MTPQERLEKWHLATSTGQQLPEPLFSIADDACDDLTESQEQVRVLREVVSNVVMNLEADKRLAKDLIACTAIDFLKGALADTEEPKP